MTIVMRKWKSHTFFIFSKYFIKCVVAVIVIIIIIIIIIGFQKKKLSAGWATTDCNHCRTWCSAFGFINNNNNNNPPRLTLDPGKQLFLWNSLRTSIIRLTCLLFIAEVDDQLLVGSHLHVLFSSPTGGL